MAGFMKLCIFLFVAVMFLTMASAQRGRGGNRGGGYRGGGGRGGGGGGRGGGRGGYGMNGGRGRIYRSVNYGEDEAYGYDSAFPGEAAYASYKPSEVRAKRAPEFPGSAPYPSFGSQGAEGQELGGAPEVPDMAPLY